MANWYSVSLIFGKLVFTFKIQFWGLNKIYRSYLFCTPYKKQECFTFIFSLLLSKNIKLECLLFLCVVNSAKMTALVQKSLIFNQFPNLIKWSKGHKIIREIRILICWLLNVMSSWTVDSPILSNFLLNWQF